MLLLYFIFIYIYFFFYLGSFCHTSCTGFIFMLGVSLTHPVLCLFFCGEFLLHIPSLLDFSVGSFSYTSHAGFFVVVVVVVSSF